MKSKIICKDTATQYLADEQTIMISGFMGNGTSEKLCDIVVESGIENYTIIANDTSVPGSGIAKLISSGKAKKVIASHIGLNPETGRLMGTGDLDVELIPQGTLAEKIRAGGFGLGGILTPTGIGTDIEHGKQIIKVNDKEYLLEEPLKADIALLHATCVDRFGNCFFKGTTKNFNVIMGPAAQKVIVTYEELLDVGQLDKELIHLSGIFVDHILEA